MKAGCQSQFPSSPEVNVTTRGQTSHHLTGVLLTFQEIKCPLKSLRSTPEHSVIFINLSFKMFDMLKLLHFAPSFTYTSISEHLCQAPLVIIGSSLFQQLALPKEVGG